MVFAIVVILLIVWNTWAAIQVVKKNKELSDDIHYTQTRLNNLKADYTNSQVLYRAEFLDHLQRIDSLQERVHNLEAVVGKQCKPKAKTKKRR